MNYEPGFYTSRGGVRVHNLLHLGQKANYCIIEKHSVAEFHLYHFIIFTLNSKVVMLVF